MNLMTRFKFFLWHFSHFKVAMIGHVGIEHPGGGLVAGAGAVVDSDESLLSKIGGDMHEIRERAGVNVGGNGQSIGPDDLEAGGPMIQV